MIQLPSMAGMPVAVLGLGRSGLGAARALHASGAEVWAWDDNAARRDAAEALEIPLRDLARIDWRRPAALVLSPGIPHTYPAPHPVAARARDAGCPIIGDIELLGRAVPRGRFIGITGTNGKSTTTALIGHILTEAGLAPQVGGNLGPAVAEFQPAAEGTYVLEMSSYQLERTFAISFEVALLLNISPDHLDRHGGLEGYTAAKRRIFETQGAGQTAIVGVDDAICRDILRRLRETGRRTVLPISCDTPVPGGVYVTDGRLIDDLDGAAAEVLNLSEVATLPGAHNAQNAAAAYAAARRFGVPARVAANAIRAFPGLAHRQEVVTALDGVTFVNDSKATNADAAVRALTSYADVYWIAGGRKKVGGLSGTERGWDRVRHAFLIGEAANSFRTELAQRMPAEVCGDLDTAVAAAFKRARQDGARNPVVLLSPACASFDQFPDFEARGEAFKRAVAALNVPAERDELTGGSA